jgi:hypothetical protein
MAHSDTERLSQRTDCCRYLVECTIRVLVLVVVVEVESVGGARERERACE